MVKRTIKAEPLITPEDDAKNTEKETKKDMPQPDNGGTEAMDFIAYCCEPNIRIGIDYRKEIKFRMDGKDMKAIIRPVSSDEISLIQSTAEMGQGSVDKLLVGLALYSTDKKSKLPDNVLDKIPSGVTSYIATQIMTLSGYNFDDDALSFLKKP